MLPDYSKLQEDLKNLYNDIDYDPFKPPCSNITVETNRINFFKERTHELITLKLDSMKSKITRLPIKKPLVGNKSLLLLPNKNIFVFGDPSDGNGQTYMIDTNYNILNLASGLFGYDFLLNYHNDFVYALGGQSNKQSSRFSLKDNVWKNLATLPNYIFNTNMTSIVFKDNILLTNNPTHKIYRYDINTQGYLMDMNIIVAHTCTKIFIEGNDNVYVLENNGNIFESNDIFT